LDHRRPTPSTPLAAALVFAGLNSFAAGTATMGVFFVAKKAFGFGEARNYGLGLVVGATYVVGALAAARVPRGVVRAGSSVRAYLALLTGALALACLAPFVWREGFVLFLFLAVYAPITGLFWPLVESYLSGGRRGARLRSAVGRFNVVWSAGVALGLLVETLFLHEDSGADRALLLFPLLALMHGASLVLLLAFPGAPARHEDDAHAVPPSYRGLLGIHRLLLALTYFVMYTLSPYLPRLVETLGIGATWHTPLASVWMFARVVTFLGMERWHGWHGRFATALLGALALVFGFAAIVLAPLAAPGAPAVALFTLGLVAFGAGAAALYTAALYYVMEVGAAGVDAGGSHEALIGLGYTLGPACGLFVTELAVRTGVSDTARDGLLLGIVATSALAALLWAVLVWRRGGRRARSAREADAAPGSSTG
jgi:hypothetical protein